MTKEKEQCTQKRKSQAEGLHRKVSQTAERCSTHTKSQLGVHRQKGVHTPERCSTHISEISSGHIHRKVPDTPEGFSRGERGKDTPAPERLESNPLPLLPNTPKHHLLRLQHALLRLRHVCIAERQHLARRRQPFCWLLLPPAPGQKNPKSICMHSSR